MSQFIVSEVEKGEFLGGYQVLDILGRGTTGTTYHVLSNVQSKEFVLKTLYLSDSMTPEWVDRLEAQNALLSKLTSPYIDRIIGSGRSGKYWFCVKDFVHDGDGKSCNLRQFLERHGGRLNHFLVYHIARQVLEALAYCHSYRDDSHKGVAHGNLKLENILISEGGFQASHFPYEVKLTDFQPYSLMTHDVIVESFLHWQTMLKQFPHLVGEEAKSQAVYSIYRNFDYQSPERDQGGKASPADDLFALGVILYELLTGRLPVGVFPLPSKLHEDIPSHWDAVIKQCLHSFPEARYPSAFSMLDDIETHLKVEDEHAPEEVTEPEKPQRRERLSITPKGMVYIPAGSYVVGSPDCGEDALPQHECETPGFYMDRTPVTNAQFARFVRETGYVTDVEKEGGGPIWIEGEWRVIPGIAWNRPHENKLPEDFPYHPVTQVTFNDALEYCEWAGNRLPTEEEWEYAAKGGQSNVRFPWGNTISNMHANFGSHSTTPVMTYHANGFGLFDMAGNVWEWTCSWYMAYPGNKTESPHFGEKYRVLRGGCWMFDGSQCHVSYRNANQPEHSYPTIGFRTVRDFQG